MLKKLKQEVVNAGVQFGAATRDAWLKADQARKRRNILFGQRLAKTIEAEQRLLRPLWGTYHLMLSHVAPQLLSILIGAGLGDKYASFACIGVIIGSMFVVGMHVLARDGEDHDRRDKQQRTACT